RAVHIGWCNFVLRSVLKFPPEVVAEGLTIPPGMEAHMPEFGEVLRPTMALLPPKGAASPKPRLLIHIVAPTQDLDRKSTRLNSTTLFRSSRCPHWLVQLCAALRSQTPTGSCRRRPDYSTRHGSTHARVR